MSYEATFTWIQEPSAEGYRLYRDAQLLESLPAIETSYVREFPDSTGVFEIEAFNRWGVGPRVQATVTIEDAATAP